MGCVNPISTEAKSDIGSGRNSLTITRTGVEEIENLYKDASGLLGKFKEISSENEANERKFFFETAANTLKNRTVGDGILAMLYIYASNGEFSEINLNFHSDPPFVTLNEDCLHESQRGIPLAWNNLIRSYESSVQQLEEMKEPAGIIINSAKNIENSARGVLYDLKFKAKKRNNIEHIISSNSQVLNSFGPKIAETQQMYQSTINTIRAYVCGKIGSITPEIIDIGKEARRAGVFVPKKIIMTFWPDETRIKNKLKPR